LNQSSDWVVMGRIAAPFGIKGWVKVQPYSEDPDALMDFESWRVGRDGQQRHYSVEAVQDHGKALVAKLAGIDDRDTAYALASTTATRRMPCADRKSRWRRAHYRRRGKTSFTGRI